MFQTDYRSLLFDTMNKLTRDQLHLVTVGVLVGYSTIVGGLAGFIVTGLIALCTFNRFMRYIVYIFLISQIWNNFGHGNLLGAFVLAAIAFLLLAAKDIKIALPFLKEANKDPDAIAASNGNPPIEPDEEALKEAAEAKAEKDRVAEEKRQQAEFDLRQSRIAMGLDPETGFDVNQTAKQDDRTED